MREAIQGINTEIAQLFGGFGAGGFGDDSEFREKFVGTDPRPVAAVAEAHAAAEFGARFAFGECPEHAAGALVRDGDAAICSADAGHCASPLGNAEIGQRGDCADREANSIRPERELQRRLLREEIQPYGAFA